MMRVGGWISDLVTRITTSPSLPPAEETPTGGRFVQDHRAGPHIRATVDRLARDLLGRHVAELPLDLPGRGVGEATLRVGDPEVHDAPDALVEHHDVLRRDVTVHELQRRSVFAFELVRGV